MKKASIFLFFIVALAGKSFSQSGITITGPTDVGIGTIATYYIVPDNPIAPSGYSYTWFVGGGIILAQNGDPYTDTVYCTVEWETGIALGQGALYVNDNYGHGGVLFTDMGLTTQSPAKQNARKEDIPMSLPDGYSQKWDELIRY